MKKTILYFGAFSLLSFSLISCSTESKKEEKASEDKSEKVQDNATEEMKSEEATLSEEEVDQLIAEINTKRKEIESGRFDQKEVSTGEMRAKVNQKWEKIHFYSKDGVVYRIKSYPHASVSKRTEEFYFDKGKLILAIVEDDGSGEKGKAEEELDKMYYYHNDEVIHEYKSEAEKEYSIKSSDGEELLQEAAEYLDVYHQMK